MQAESLPLDLKKLSAALKRPGMPSQAVIGAAAGVSQSTVSRAIAGLIGESPGAQSLWKYIQSRPAETPPQEAKKDEQDSDAKQKLRLKLYDSRLKKAAIERLQAYLDDEFDPQLVIEQIGVLRRAQRVYAPGRKPHAISRNS